MHKNWAKNPTQNAAQQQQREHGGEARADRDADRLPIQPQVTELHEPPETEDESLLSVSILAAKTPERDAGDDARRGEI